MGAEASRVRPPAVAGTFYPGDPRRLEAEVRRLLDEAGPPPRAGRRDALPAALVAPHAGYVFSGPVAATAFRAVAPAAARIRRVVLLGPAHRVPLRGLATPAATAFRTPLGDVPVDAGLIARAEALPQVTADPRPHAPEHSLEVELPFLQVLLGDFSLLPLVVGRASSEEVAEVLETVWEEGGSAPADVLVVVSSDLSHYLPYDEARRRDEATCRRILDLDPGLRPDDACGAFPINGLLAAARRRGLAPALLDLRSSGDTGGDRHAVVGYAAISFA